MSPPVSPRADKATAPDETNALSGDVARGVLAAAHALGKDAAAWRRALGAGGRALDDPRGRLSYAAEEALWQRVADELDPFAGLKLGSAMRRGGLGALDYAVRTSPDVRVALALLCQRSAHLFGTSRLSEHSDGALVGLAYVSPRVTAGNITRTSAEFALAATATLLREAAGESLTIARLSLAEHSRSEEESADFAAELLGGSVEKVEMLAATDALLLEDASLELRMIDADPELHRHMLRLLGAFDVRASTNEDVVARATVILRQQLGRGGTGLTSVARAMGMSSRLLQLRLSERDTTFRDLLNQVRAQETAKMLRDPKRTLPEIAERVGFRDVRSLHRAFKRAYGTTPHVYRKRIDRPDAG